MNECRDLSNGVTTSKTRTAQAGTQELCEVCSQVELESFYTPSPICSSCSPHHYHIGKVEDILSRKSCCALCRLISALYDSARLFMSVQDPSGKVCALVRTLISSDEVQVCFHGISDGWDIENRGTIYRIRRCVEEGMEENSVLEGWSRWPTPIKPSSPQPATITFDKKPRRVAGRQMQSRQVDYNLIKEWLHVCEASHGATCSPRTLISRKASKIRLIDVVSGQIIDGTTNDRYCALSYVWGTHEQVCLNRENDGDMRMAHGVLVEDLPRAIKDAINIVIKIGQKYLWVDRLCILMDDEQDKLEQMSNMDQIYNSAILTIISPHACCANACIPGIEPDTRFSRQHSEIIRGVRYITTQSDPRPDVLLSNWSTRGWTYQEGFLSSRCLVFTLYQAYLQCKSETFCEDSYSNGVPQEKNTSLVGNSICHLPDIHYEISRCSFYQYIDAIEVYSMRNLTVEADVLWAFTGITRAFEPRFPGGFIWGLPVQNIDAALLWKPSRSSSGLRKGLHSEIIGSQTIRLPFPTWSWTSWIGGIEFDEKCEEKIKGLVKWEQPVRYAVSATCPFSEPWIPAAEYERDNSSRNEQIPSPHLILDERSLGLLRFTTESVALNIEPVRLESLPPSDPDATDLTVSTSLCEVRTCQGDIISDIIVPSAWLKTRSHKKADFVLLSLCIEHKESATCVPKLTVIDSERSVEKKIKHIDDCEHQSVYNVMLIDWKDGPHHSMAYRVGISKIQKENWIKLKRISKSIILG